jgi:hypothetical protein
LRCAPLFRDGDSVAVEIYTDDRTSGTHERADKKADVARSAANVKTRIPGLMPAWCNIRSVSGSNIWACSIRRSYSPAFRPSA